MGVAVRYPGVGNIPIFLGGCAAGVPSTLARFRWIGDSSATSVSLVTRVIGGLNGVVGLLASAVFLFRVFRGCGLFGSASFAVLFVGVTGYLAVAGFVE